MKSLRSFFFGLCCSVLTCIILPPSRLVFFLEGLRAPLQTKLENEKASHDDR